MVFVEALFTVGFGLTVMVNDCDEPWQFVPPLANVGVTVIVAVTGAVPALTALKEAIDEPDPVAARPIDGVLLVHE